MIRKALDKEGNKTYFIETYYFRKEGKETVKRKRRTPYELKLGKTNRGGRIPAGIYGKFIKPQESR